jgi:hypothetical protein
LSDGKNMTRVRTDNLICCLNGLLIDPGISLQKIQQLTDYLSTSVTERYYHLDGLEDVAAIQREMFQLIKKWDKQ